MILDHNSTNRVARSQLENLAQVVLNVEEVARLDLARSAIVARVEHVRELLSIGIVRLSLVVLWLGLGLRVGRGGALVIHPLLGIGRPRGLELTGLLALRNRRTEGANVKVAVVAGSRGRSRRSRIGYRRSIV